MYEGDVDVRLWVQLTLKSQHSSVDSSSCPISAKEAANVLYRVKVSQGKHLVSFSPTNFDQVLKITTSCSLNKSLKLSPFSNSNPYVGLLMCCHFEKLNYITGKGTDKPRIDRIQ